jgi:hypothetical protein
LGKSVGKLLRRNEMKRIFFLTFLIFLFQNVQAEEQKLSEAYEQQLIERVRGVYSGGGTKEKLERPICATPIFLEVRANWDRLSAETRKILQSYTTRPTFSFPEYTYDTPQGHFKIHYTRQGDSAVFHPDEDKNPNNGQPDWVDACAEVLEHVWDTEINVLAYNHPPSDGWYPDTSDNGGDGKYDVYLVNFSGGEAGFLGKTEGEYFLSPSSVSATSYLVLDNDYTNYGIRHSQIEWLQVTAAHEFFHAIQMGYDATEYEQENEQVKPYWMEMSAVWMEDIVYDGVNDYVGYLPHFFNEPWLSLKTFESVYDQHAYGSCVWPIYLAERKYPSRPDGFDTSIIKNIWEECAKVDGDNVLDPKDESATDKALKARGTNFEDAFREFTMWNYFTADKARPQVFYSEGDTFPKVKVDNLQYHQVHLDPVDVTSPPHLPENLGSNYVVFVPDPELKEGGLKIDFDGHGEDYLYNVSVLGYNPSVLEPFEASFLFNPATQTGAAKVYNWNTYTEVIMIPTVIIRSPNYSWTYEYHAVYDSSLHGESPLPGEDRILQNFPNPFVIETESDRTYFPFVLSLPSRVRIDILTMSGERIRTIIPKYDPKLAIGEYLDKNLAMPWDGRNEEGEYVSSGIYLYRFRTDRASVIKKLAVIR